MLGISRIYHQLVGNVIHGARGLVPYSTTSHSSGAAGSSDSILITQSEDHDAVVRNTSSKQEQEALTTVFGMDEQGRIQKEKACQIMNNLGLIINSSTADGEDDLSTLTEDEQQQVEDATRKREEVVRAAFMVFDVDGDGYIDAKELKRVLVCLGLDNGWDLGQVELMIKSADLNLDGKIDFHEFQLMMG